MPTCKTCGVPTKFFGTCSSCKQKKFKDNAYRYGTHTCKGSHCTAIVAKNESYCGACKYKIFVKK